MNQPKSELFGIKIDAIDMTQAVQRVVGWIEAKRTNHGDLACRYVVTPNVDHAVLLQENETLRHAYESADLVLADGHPIVWASKILGQPVPERVPGSDLVPALFSSATTHQPVSVFLLGAAPGVGRRAMNAIRNRWQNVKMAGIYSPPIGFQNDPVECDYILGRIALSRPDILVVGLGAPKQECWVYQHRDQIQAGVALCVGATIDFLAGEQKRAPVWMQRTGIEWLHRMCSDPKRLVKRYARDAWVFPQLVMQQWFANRTQKPA